MARSAKRGAESRRKGWWDDGEELDGVEVDLECASGRPYGAEDWVEVISITSASSQWPRAVVVIRLAKKMY